MKICPQCKGTGLGHPIYHAGAEFTPDGIEDTRCEQCDGVGHIQPIYIGVDMANGKDHTAIYEPSEKEWMDMIKRQIAQSFEQIQKQMDELTKAFLSRKR